MTKKQIEEKWKKLEAAMIPYTDHPDTIVAAIREHYKIYEPKCMQWLGSLFDSEIGGFYYSNSARDGEEFFPDIESTAQAIAVLECSGAMASYNDVPEWMRSRIASFICSCEDPESGYFYNPQWSKSLTNQRLTRRARDSSYAMDLAEMCNFEMPYPTFISRIQNNENNTIPEFLKSRTHFLEKLNSLNFNEEIYTNMHWFASQNDQIISAGLGQCAIEFIESKQDKVTGLWGEGYIDDVKKIKTLNAVVTFYRVMHTPIKNTEKIIDFVIKMFDVEYTGDITYLVARWGILKNLIQVLSNQGDSESISKVRELVTKINAKAVYMIKKTTDNLKVFKREDGSFSYNSNGASPTSQQMIVARSDACEGDVNATLLAISVAEKIISTLTVSADVVPVFTNEDVKAFDAMAGG